MLLTTIDVTVVVYQSYPTNAPKFFPKDWFASWLEQYAKVQGLVVWTDSFLERSPTYNVATGKWDLVVTRKGEHVHLRPSHIVIATSIHGKPNLPLVPGSDDFRANFCIQAPTKVAEAFQAREFLSLELEIPQQISVKTWSLKELRRLSCFSVRPRPSYRTNTTTVE